MHIVQILYDTAAAIVGFIFCTGLALQLVLIPLYDVAKSKQQRQQSK